MSEVLVLSRDFSPIDTISWERAMTLLYEEKIEVLASYDDRVIHSVTMEFKVPSVIRFLRKTPARKKGIKFSRDAMYSRDHGACRYCGKSIARAEATYDHVTPRVAGGKTNWTNCLIACRFCNQKKGARTPAQAGLRMFPCKVPGCENHKGSMPVKPAKLSDSMFLTLSWNKGMPDSWRGYIRDAAASVEYWHGALEED